AHSRNPSPPAVANCPSRIAAGFCWLGMESFAGGGATVGTVAHPASGALAEVVVDPRVGSGRGQKRDGLQRAHEAGLVKADADRLAGAKGEQRFLLAHVPVPVAWAHPVRD